MASLRDLHGAVRRCTMCKPKGGLTHIFCTHCYDRGFVSHCKACDGAGKTTVPVGGSVGTMESTCTYCGGSGTFPAHEKEFVEQGGDVAASTSAQEAELFPAQADSEKPRMLQPADV